MSRIATARPKRTLLFVLLFVVIAGVVGGPVAGVAADRGRVHRDRVGLGARRGAHRGGDRHAGRARAWSR